MAAGPFVFGNLLCSTNSLRFPKSHTSAVVGSTIRWFSSLLRNLMKVCQPRCQGHSNIAPNDRNLIFLFRSRQWLVDFRLRSLSTNLKKQFIEQDKWNSADSAFMFLIIQSQNQWSGQRIWPCLVWSLIERWPGWFWFRIYRGWWVPD